MEKSTSATPFAPPSSGSRRAFPAPPTKSSPISSTCPPPPPPHSWAIMNSDPATKRRFLSRVLAFIGYRDDFIEFAGGAIDLKRTSHHHRRCAALVAWVPRAFLPVMGYLIRAKNHSAIVPIPIFGSHAATAGSTICFVANDAATFANT
jgi:hypothetical protein